MTEQEILLNGIEEHIKDQNYSNFDELILGEFFDEMLIEKDPSRLRVDGYNDAGIDYIITLCNKRQFFEIEDLKELLDTKNNIIDIHVIQIKDSQTLSSEVPNKFLEISNNILSGKNANSYRHYNQEIKDFIKLINEILAKYATKMKLSFHFYYFNKSSKNALEGAKNLDGCFETLIRIFEKIDYCHPATFNIYGSSDIFRVISSSRTFEYTFKDIEKFEVEVDSEKNQVSALIALIPLKQYFDLITFESDGLINDKIFESNIRDFKGRSIVNEKISETLQNIPNDDETEKNKIKIDFWWLNNGVTITVEDLRESKSQKQITITNPQIVNGLQTSYSIYNFFKNNSSQLELEDRKIFAKIIKIPSDRDDLVLNITVATNSQNEIRDKDIHANDEVQKRIELYFKQHGKFYQRKDKYYTNRKVLKNNIVNLNDMAKYINTIFLKDPSFTRNNPGKLLQGKKYDDIFQINKIDQNYERYLLAYKIYEKVQKMYRGKLKIERDEFEKANFIHHIVFIVVCEYFKTVDYNPTQLLNIKIDDITDKDIMNAQDIILRILEDNNVSNAKVLKKIKEQSFTKNIITYLSDKYINPCHH